MLLAVDHAAASGFPGLIAQHSRVASASQCRFGHPEPMLCVMRLRAGTNAARQPHCSSHACLGYTFRCETLSQSV